VAGERGHRYILGAAYRDPERVVCARFRPEN
jgi:hypothetical protein